MLTWIQSTASLRVLRWWLRSHAVFVFSCKISTLQNGTVRKYRATILQTGRKLVDAEAFARNAVDQWADQNRAKLDAEPEVKWLRERPVISSSLDLESETIIQLLEQLRRDGAQDRSLVEEVALSAVE